MFVKHFLTILISSAVAVSIPTDYKYNECHPNNDTCEYWLVVKEKLTMLLDGELVYADNGKLYKYNEHPSNYTTNVSFHCHT